MDVEGYERYVGRLVERGNLSADTQRKYVGAVGRFNEWRGGATSEPDIGTIKDYIMSRATEDDLSGASLNVAKCAFRKYLVYQNRSDEYADLRDWFNEHFTVSSTAKTDRLTEEELEAFRAAAAGDPRAGAIVEIFNATGLRVGEIVRMDRDDITFDAGSVPDFEGEHAGAIKIHRQKRGEAVSDHRPLNERAVGAVDHYIDSLDQYAGVDAVSSPGLFVNDRPARLSSDKIPGGVEADTTVNGEPATYRVTTQRINSILKDVAAKTDHPDVTPERMHAHLLRHTVGSRLGDQGYTAKQVGEFLGRVSPAESYVHTGSEAISEMATHLDGD